MLVVNDSNVTAKGHGLETASAQKLDVWSSVAPFSLLCLAFCELYGDHRLPLKLRNLGAERGEKRAMTKKRKQSESDGRRRTGASYLCTKLWQAHLLDLCDGFFCQLIQILIDPLPVLFPPSSLGDHRIVAVSCSCAPTGLFLGNLICEQPVAYHQVAFWDVKAFLGDTGGDQEVESGLAEITNGVLLLFLQEKCT